MVKRRITLLLLGCFFSGTLFSLPVQAANPMGYDLLSVSSAASLPHGGGSLGMDVGAAQQITDADMTFDVLIVNVVRPASAAAGAGFRQGDEIIAVDGHVFPSVAAFAAFVGSQAPGTAISVDYIPQGGGPQQAQRISVVMGGPASNVAAAPTVPAASPSAGLSNGKKLAIGLGAAALFGCYKLGCFSHLTTH